MGKDKENLNPSKNIVILVIILVLGGAIAIAKYIVIPRYFPSSILGTTVGVGKIIEVQPSEQTDYALDSSTYPQDAITVISNFEKTESSAWQGGGVIDDKVYYEGTSAMGLISVDRKAITITLEKQLDLTSMEQIEFMLHVTDAGAYETVMIDFGDLEMKSYYRYTLSNLANGWNLIQIPKEKFVLSQAKDSIFGWANVAKTRVYTLSRLGSIFLARIDMLRSINNSAVFTNQWMTLNPKKFLSLYEQGEKSKLMVRNIGASVAILKDVQELGNFIFSASISPYSTGKSGLFLRGDSNTTYGYYLLIGGEKSSTWQILKKNKLGWTVKEEIVEGVLANATFSRDKRYWLRAESRGDLLEFYFSFDGQKYEKLGEINDSEFRSGGIGVAVIGGWSLFDDFQLRKL